jgi:hypothetical protein
MRGFYPLFARSLFRQLDLIKLRITEKVQRRRFQIVRRSDDLDHAFGLKFLGKGLVLRSTGSPICCHKSMPPCRLATRGKPASRRITVA